ncbi:hypothetical protein T09_11439 [Trichinella sp. T9]|nr:hypothetical protein T09_11439 [Trichinella sp. T9]
MAFNTCLPSTAITVFSNPSLVRVAPGNLMLPNNA